MCVPSRQLLSFHLSRSCDATWAPHGRLLTLAGFLKHAAKLAAPPPCDAPTSLPPPLEPPVPELDIPADSAWWGVPTLKGWLQISGAPISEEGGWQLAEAAAARARRNGRSGFASGHLGERSGAGDDADGKAAPRPSYISPFLRWGLLSARQAAAAGVRVRDLLWRDFSRLCWRSLAPLRNGVPVIQAVPLEDMEAVELSALRSRLSEATWQWTPELAPHDDSLLMPALVPVSEALEVLESSASPSAAIGRLIADDSGSDSLLATRRGTRGPPTWGAILGLKDEEAFEAWCTGRTGAPLVDAGMIQLWACGWMPRRIRLLCAACLVEGLGLDWRLGRDWFAYALTDHDYAINECMWQNAGLVGVDPFYRGLKWDVLPTEANDGEAAGVETDDERSGYTASSRYTRRWLDLPPLAIPPWPPALHAAVARPRPPAHRVQQVAEARRSLLTAAYRYGGRVSRVGLRVTRTVQGEDVNRETSLAGEQPPLAAERLGAPGLYRFVPTPGTLTLRDSMGFKADEVVEVGHMSYRVPPITHGKTWIAAKKASVLTVAASAAPLWQALTRRLEAAPADSASARGSAAAQAHSRKARDAAARKLISNHVEVLQDTTNPARWTNVRGRPLTQPELSRVHLSSAHVAEHVDSALREVAIRLLGQRLGDGAMEEGSAFDQSNTAQAAAWAAATEYVASRLQRTPGQKPGREPEMSAKATSAMCAVLREVGALHPTRKVPDAGKGAGWDGSENESTDVQRGCEKAAVRDDDVAQASPSAPRGPFVLLPMLHCARDGCLPCRATILRAAQQKPGQSARPETCPRLASHFGGPSGAKQQSRPQKQKPRPAVAAVPPMQQAETMGLYRRGQWILTVGDGDFSFSLALARTLGGSMVVATSHESRESLLRIYGQACAETLSELGELGATVIHGVDAGDLAATLPAACRPAAGFDRAVWNFPCVARGSDGRVLEGAGAGADARGSAELEANRQLISRFCAGSACLLAPGGEVHMTHKVGLQQWNIEQQGEGSGGGDATTSAEGRAEGSARGTGLVYAGAVVFDRAAYPPYRPRKALDKSSFPISDAQTFVFAKGASRSATIRTATIRTATHLQ